MKKFHLGYTSPSVPPQEHVTEYWKKGIILKIHKYEVLFEQMKS